MILAVAVRSGARRVLSEGLNAGQTIAGLTIHNPFVRLNSAAEKVRVQGDAKLLVPAVD